MSSRRPTEEAQSVLHPLAAGIVLILAIGGVLAAGIWGLAAPRGHADGDAAAEHAGHAATATADAITFTGGQVTVGRVSDVDLSMPMQGPGMGMPPPEQGVPKVPVGYRLIDVEVTLRALAGSGLRFQALRFQVQGEGIAPTRPLPTTGEAGNYVPPRGFLSRTLTFQVPDSAHDLELTVEGGDQPLPLKLGPSPAGGHSGH